MKTFLAPVVFAVLSTNISTTAEPIRTIPRDLNTVVSEATDAGSSGVAIAMYTAGSGGLALSTCSLLANHGVVPAADCQPFAGIIASSTLLIYSIVTSQQTGIETASRRSGSFLADQLGATGTEFESISAMPISRRRLEQRYDNPTGQGSSTMQDRVSIHKLKPQDGYIDAIVTTYIDGTGHAFATPTPVNATSLTERHDGAGFKINYQLLKGFRFLIAPDISAAVAVSQGFAQDWAIRTNNDKIDEYSGTTSIKNVEKFGIRIISEIEGFGEDFEPVNICGSLSSSHNKI